VLDAGSAQAFTDLTCFECHDDVRIRHPFEISKDAPLFLLWHFCSLAADPSLADGAGNAVSDFPAVHAPGRKEIRIGRATRALSAELLDLSVLEPFPGTIGDHRRT